MYVRGPKSDPAISDALKHWVNDGADGFRFDLMGAMPISTVGSWEKSLNQLYRKTHQSDLLFYGEPWSAGGYVPAGGAAANQYNLDQGPSGTQGLIGAFFDNFRDGG